MKQKLVFLMLAFLALATPVFAQGGGIKDMGSLK